MDRRTFLSIVAGSPLVFGLRELLAQDPDDPRPGYFRDALSRMKHLDFPGIVLLIPNSRKERDRLGAALCERLNGDSALVRQILTSCVLICLPAGIVPLSPEDKSNRLLLDAGGGKIAGDVLDLSTVEDPAKFVESFHRFLHGEKGERLEARAGKARAAATPQVLEALKDLESEEAAVREKATAIITRDAVELQPLLVHRMKGQESTELGLRLKNILEKLYTGSAEKAPGPRLPFGTRIVEVWQPVEDGRGHDPCPGCGMAAPLMRHKKFLRFYSHADE